jgi:hypothetical protein
MHRFPPVGGPSRHVSAYAARRARRAS